MQTENWSYWLDNHHCLKQNKLLKATKQRHCWIVKTMWANLKSNQQKGNKRQYMGHRGLRDEYKQHQFNRFTFTCALQEFRGQFCKYGTVMLACWHTGTHKYTGKSCHSLLCAVSNTIPYRRSYYIYHICASFQHASS